MRLHSRSDEGSNEQGETSKDTVTDLSDSCLSFARMVDRLPPGEHVIEVTKRKTRDWDVRVSCKRHSDLPPFLEDRFDSERDDSVE